MIVFVKKVRKLIITLFDYIHPIKLMCFGKNCVLAM